jgi:CubicO group peptidase (beta-lactamase class C family)
MDAFGVVPGVGICVVQGDRTVYLKGFGYRDVKERLPVTAETGFYIASSTKPFVGMTASVLAVQGRLDLDAPVSRYLPDLELPAPLSADDLTLREMLTHRTGIDNRAVQIQLAFKGSLDIEAFYEMMRSQSQPMPTRFIYSNLGYNMMGYVLAAATGKPWQEVVTEAVLEPVGMNHTTTSIEQAARRNFARPYSKEGENWVDVDLKNDETMHAAGGLVTTPADLGRWLIVNLNDGKIGERTVLDPDAVRIAHESCTSLEATFYRFERRGYALGWYHADFDGELLMHHFGGFNGYHAHMSFMPEHGIGVAVLINTNDYDAGTMAHMIAAYVYELLLGRDDVETRYRAELQTNAKRTTALKRFEDDINAGMTTVTEGEVDAGTRMILSAIEEGRAAGVVEEGTINQLGYALLKGGHAEAAIAIFEYNITSFPESPNVYDSLGEALESAGRIDEARSSYRKAWEKAKAQGDGDAALYKKNYDRVAGGPH